MTTSKFEWDKAMNANVADAFLGMKRPARCWLVNISPPTASPACVSRRPELWRRKVACA
jgi:hypothetical protein